MGIARYEFIGIEEHAMVNMYSTRKRLIVLISKSDLSPRFDNRKIWTISLNFTVFAETWRTWYQLQPESQISLGLG